MESEPEVSRAVLLLAFCGQGTALQRPAGVQPKGRAKGFVFFDPREAVARAAKSAHGFFLTFFLRRT